MSPDRFPINRKYTPIKFPSIENVRKTSLFYNPRTQNRTFLYIRKFTSNSTFVSYWLHPRFERVVTVIHCDSVRWWFCSKGIVCLIYFRWKKNIEYTAEKRPTNSIYIILSFKKKKRNGIQIFANCTNNAWIWLIPFGTSHQRTSHIVIIM